MPLDCGTWCDADLRNCLISNIAFLTRQDVSFLIKCFGFKIGTPKDRFKVTRYLKEELPAVTLRSKVLKIDE